MRAIGFRPSSLALPRVMMTAADACMGGVAWRYLRHRKGPLTVAAGYAGGFFRSDSAVDERPDIQVHFITFSTGKLPLSCSVKRVAAVCLRS